MESVYVFAVVLGHLVLFGMGALLLMGAVLRLYFTWKR